MKFPDIAGWMSETDLQFLYEEASKVPEFGIIVELGSWLGRSTAAIIMGAKTRNIFSVDTWQGCESEPFPEEKRKYFMELFKQDMKIFAGFVPIIFDTTTDRAARCFADRSIDFLFLDGDHSEPQVYWDLVNWLPKMKDNGIFAGHDWSNPNIRQAFRKVFSSVKQPELSGGDIWRIDIPSFGRGS